MSDADRARRARARRARATLVRGRLGSRELDLDPIQGAAAISLVTALTRESWSEAGLDVPSYSRSSIPICFVPWSRRDRAP